MGTAVNIVTRKLGIPLEIVLTIGSETKKVAIAFGDLKIWVLKKWNLIAEIVSREVEVMDKDIAAYL